MSKDPWDSEQVFELAKDVVITPVTNIRQDIRAQFIYEKTDFVVTRPHGRAHSLVIEKEVAEFFKTFRNPITLKQAVQNFSHENDMDVDAFMQDITDAVKKMLIAGFLIEPASKPIIDYNLIFGEIIIDDVEILNGHIVLDETEIYRCKNASGHILALKIAKHPHDEKTNTLIKREYDVLRAAPHPLTPQPHRTGNYKDRAYVLMDWIEGQDILITANYIRKSITGADQFSKLKALVIDLLLAYKELHIAGIVHADIHPKNCLISADGSVHIIDFGLALYKPIADIHPLPDRRGVPYFYDPLVATAFLDKKKPPSATIASDVYGLAALSFLLLTAHHYLPFRLDRSFFFQQIKLETLRSFQSIGVPSRPAIEAVLARALSKNENERFAPPSAFAEALSAADDSIDNGDSGKKADPSEARKTIARFQREGLDFDWPLQPPTAPIHFGAAGIAYTLLKCAEISQDANALSDADIWITRAKTAKEPLAYNSDNPAIGISEKAITPQSLHYGRFGVCICEAMIALARWDCFTVNSTIKEICTVALDAPIDFDLMSGKPGALLGCALLLEVLPDDPLLPSKQSLINAGHRIASDLIEKLSMVGHISANKTIKHMGIAHGWAGVLYALMRWSEVVQELPGKLVKQYLQELANMSIPAKIGRRWPIMIDSPQNVIDRFSASWCKGSSGLAHLFGLAFDTYGDQDFLNIAVAAANHAFSMPSNGATLCCGDAGVAYAQLAMYRLTKVNTFLERARVLINRAGNNKLNLSSSLYKGSLGIHLLALELMSPQEARMPFFERAGWPVMLSVNSSNNVKKSSHA